ncbi:3'-5' exonuclease [Streptomyces chartreusis]|uniref:3'-5' exonuclease n=1 Tax=Streptomyces chartreusis TaxID=1969 RepID=UPI0038234810
MPLRGRRATPSPGSALGRRAGPLGRARPGSPLGSPGPRRPGRLRDSRPGNDRARCYRPRGRGGITTAAGETLVDTLVNPGVPIPEEATAQHGITDADVQDVPGFGDVLPLITEALRGRGVIIYNRVFDTGILRFEVDRYHRAHTPALPGLSLPENEWHPAALEWMRAQQWEPCAMLAYAVHIGEWSDHWGGWAWQKLHCGHQARGDCLAVVRVLHQIADARDPEPVASLDEDHAGAGVVVLVGHDEAGTDTE